VTFNDETETVAVVQNGWYLAWWPAPKDPGGIVSANNRNEVQDSVEGPTDSVEGRVSAAAWWVDTAALPVTAKATTVRGIVRERVCASGQSPRGRIRAPVVAAGASEVTVTVWIARQPGDQDCPGNPEVPLTIDLGEALGTRALLDGGSTPPRDATVRPG
jgi:hypothetical protein